MEPKPIGKPNLKIITLFSGIGMQEVGISKNDIDYELVRYCEYEKKISTCFDIIHNTEPDKNWGDITKLNIDEEYDKIKQEGHKSIDLIISSFPCQSFSIAGKKEGFECKKNGGLFDKTQEIVNKFKPRIIILENVKNITSKKFGAIKYITDSMNTSGYKCFHKILNAKDYGIPQNRERWFMVCVKETEKDFVFPSPIPLETCVNDYIDKSVKSSDRKCAERLVPYFKEEHKKEYRSMRGLIKVFDGHTQEFKEKKNDKFKTGFTLSRIYSTEGVSPTLTTSNDTHFYEIKGRLTSLERWKLMGLEEDDYHLLKDNEVSDSTIDKITGNGIVVDVFEHLMKSVINIYL
jgi:DNA-cytosine methyltransferase